MIGDLNISLTCGQVAWHWTLTDACGDHITYGSRASYRDACDDALLEYDKALARMRRAEGGIHG